MSLCRRIGGCPSKAWRHMCDAIKWVMRTLSETITCCLQCTCGECVNNCKMTTRVNVCTCIWRIIIAALVIFLVFWYSPPFREFVAYMCTGFVNANRSMDNVDPEASTMGRRMLRSTAP